MAAYFKCICLIKNIVNANEKLKRRRKRASLMKGRVEFQHGSHRGEIWRIFVEVSKYKIRRNSVVRFFAYNIFDSQLK